MKHADPLVKDDRVFFNCVVQTCLIVDSFNDRWYGTLKKNKSCDPMEPNDSSSVQKRKIWL